MGSQVDGGRAGSSASRPRAVLILAALWFSIVGAGIVAGTALTGPSAGASSGQRSQLTVPDPSLPTTISPPSTLPPVTDPPVTDPPVTDPPTTSPPTSAWRPPQTTAQQWVPPSTAAASTTVTTTEDLLVGPTVSSTTTSTSSTTLAPRLGSSTTTTGGRSDPKVWAVVAGLGGVGLVLGALTFRFWQRTRPAAGDEIDADEPAGGDGGGGDGGGDGTPPGSGRRKRGRSRYGDIVITVPEPE